MLRLFRAVRVTARYSHYDATSSVAKKLSIVDIYDMYHRKEPVSCLTAHDCISGRMADLAGVDIVLVGDSLAMVAMGYKDTNSIELDEMIYHARAVARGAKRPFLIADLPFGSYEKSVEQACESAIKMVKKGHIEAVKMEGGEELVPTIKHLSSYGLLTVPHLGLTPQRQASTGGFKVQGKTAESAKRILDAAYKLQDAGASMLLLEGIPDRVAALITSKLRIPTIGIGAGSGTSGQVLVQLDMLGGFDSFVPKFLKRYSDYLERNVAAIGQYHKEVKARQFPTREHSYVIKNAEFEKFKELANLEN